MGLFGKTPQRNPKELVNEWCHKIRKEGYQLDRQIRGIEREEDKIKRSLKEAAKKGDRDVCVMLAKEIIRSRKAINKIHTTKAHLNSISMQMKNQLATLRVAGSLAKSTEVMQAMQSLVRIPQISQTMQEMSREMMKAGIIEEMLDETMEVLEDTEEMEDQAQSEIDKVLWELTEGKLGEAPAPPVATTEGPSTAAETEPNVLLEDNPEELEEMQNRLSALRS
ncbi:charged multivesicular body protein 3 [Chrysoperla carnea]|uniref:charged multivesicular body protein 3 n=1 Tax=Chrysoperla carnea TaxID=189513 RepID=UPI001D078DED|nr:charged multivesicular body protein 3 [Chrysoperla carnea]